MLFDDKFLDEVSRQAKESPRLRMNYNLHESLDSKAQRLFNAVEPGTKLAIHRHPHTDETYMVVRGHIRILFYNDKKETIKVFDVNPLEGKYGVQIPKMMWHSIEVLDSGTVVFSVKDGPYIPSAPEDLL